MIINIWLNNNKNMYNYNIKNNKLLYTNFFIIDHILLNEIINLFEKILFNLKIEFNAIIIIFINVLFI